MTALNTKTFATMVSDQVTSIQSKASQLINFTIGSVLRALVETNAALGLWLQSMIIQVLGVTRASTSSDSDLDSWMADYGVTRIAATAAVGQVTFSRFTPTTQAIVPIGSIVQTADGSLQYAVTVDLSNPSYTTAGYVIAAGTASVTVPVQALVAGASGNAAANLVTALAQTILYVDTVTNAAAFSGGADAESDTALRARFVAYIASLSKATVTAIGYAIAAAELGAYYSIVENKKYDGSADLGYFYIVVDDGSGSPPAAFITTVTNAVDAVRPITTRFGIYTPNVITAAVAMTVTVASGYDAAATRALVVTALQTYINSLALGQTLQYTRLAAIAYGASAGVANVSGVTLNAGTADLTATAQQVIKHSTVVVS
ncbi:baseplate protein [Duganella sp. FT80W]|uniref:Baseplate protein n=1 Tax=Duganella guangzhouensis TaxID=2666084 RepID=A0A6I2KUV5_9BURK|nr:baseplate J/gp47 family protein [Duganella guangzhouensis]MRW88877.1 baseplate protein [Duganella guangzhouensis]